MRDKTIDGYRAVAALGVVFAHAVTYRFAAVPWLHYPQRLASPLSQTSVQLFFVISGFIITTLLVRERQQNGSVSIAAFYVRRVCRIIPPLAAVILTVALLGLVDGPSLAMASTFTCNIGDCHWAVAHTWSLSVEEQYYLIWPMLLVAINPKPSTLALAIGIDFLAFLVAPLSWHSNYISFACIGVGALYAMNPIQFRPNIITWAGVAATLVLGPLFLPAKLVQMAAPFLIVYLLFGTPEWAKRILATRPIQVVGLSSYSIYLWQQLFLGKDGLPLWDLPVMVALSVLLIEQPFIQLGRHLARAHAARFNVKSIASTPGN